MEQQSALLVFPKDPARQLDIGIKTYIPLAGSVVVQCDVCKMDAWMGPKQKAIKESAPDTKVLCPMCALHSGIELTTVSLGKHGASIWTTDGKEFVPDRKDQ